MKTFINPNYIIRAKINEPREGYVCDILGFIPSTGWQLLLELRDSIEVIVECDSEAQCIAWCNTFNLTQID
jgi:hypothetical protein